MLSAEYIRTRVIYDAATGIFTWLHCGKKPKTWNTRFAGKRAGSLNKSLGYRTICFNGKNYYEHQIAVLLMTGEWPEFDVDHRDGSGCNNAWGNLRQATKSQNGANRPANRANRSGFKGVSWNAADRRWVASIGHNGRTIRIGSFMAPEDAREAYEETAAKLQGEFAYTDAAKVADRFPGADGGLPKMRKAKI